MIIFHSLDVFPHREAEPNTHRRAEVTLAEVAKVYRQRYTPWYLHRTLDLALLTPVNFCRILCTHADHFRENALHGVARCCFVVLVFYDKCAEKQLRQQESVPTTNAKMRDFRRSFPSCSQQDKRRVQLCD